MGTAAIIGRATSKAAADRDKGLYMVLICESSLVGSVRGDGSE